MPAALAILAHPDDVEFLCAGTLARLRNECGWSIHLATVTAGDCGSAELAPEEIAMIRKAEASAAAKVLGGDYTCLGERDLRVVYHEAVLEKTVRLINRIQPLIVFTHSPDDYHLDHEETSKIVRGATFAAPIPNFLSHHEHPLLAHIPHLYYCDPLEGFDMMGRAIVPAFRIDITKSIELKASSLACHESQRAWLRKHHGVDNLVENMRTLSGAQGKACGVAYAEGFRQHLGHSYPRNNLLCELLGQV